MCQLHVQCNINSFIHQPVYCKKSGEITPKGVFLQYLRKIYVVMSESWYMF